MSSRGFTLIEVVLAIALLSLLASIAVPSYMGFAERGRVAQAISDMGRIQLAVERHRLNNNDEFPPAWPRSNWTRSRTPGDDPTNI